MTKSLSFSPLALLLLVPALWIVGCEGVGSCTCVPCGTAIQLSVVDDANNPLIDEEWSVEATVDGDVVTDTGNCAPDFRFSNTCGFGSQTGMYHLIIRAPGFEPREMAARFAAESGQDCCRCLGAAVVTATLERQEG